MTRCARSGFCSNTLQLLACVALLSSCAVGPDYQRPELAVPEKFVQPATGTPADSQWKTATPQLPDAAWWALFNDDVLNDLVRQLNEQNQDIRVAEARYRQARALAAGARTGFLPTLNANASVTRGAAAEREVAGSTEERNSIATTRRLALDAQWEADIWGRVRRDVEAGVAAQQASKADVAATQLSAQSELVLNYYRLRVANAQQQLLNRTVQAYDQLLQMAQNRYAVGVAGRADIVQARTQFNAAKTQATNAELARVKLQNAIAVLLGQAPENFALPLTAQTWEEDKTAQQLADAYLPTAPLALPSQLLERRPDIAAAERRVIAANARIGVAQAAYFPTLTLNAAGGYQGTSASDWLTTPHRFWSLGPALATPLFDGGLFDGGLFGGGLRGAQKQQAQAYYDETVAQYRQTVLTGFQEVEDNLASLSLFAQSAQSQDNAVQSARESVRIASNQYKVGKVALLDVITLQTIANSNEHEALQLLGERYAAYIGLVKSLGGGWDVSQLASADADDAEQ